MTTTPCPEGALAAADDIVGPTTATTKSAVVAVTGTMTAGRVVVEYQFPGSTTWYPCDDITVAKLQQIAANNGTDYGYATEIEIPGGGIVRLRTDDAFVGTLTAYLRAVMPGD
jgi:hypothetical protein